MVADIPNWKRTKRHSQLTYHKYRGRFVDWKLDYVVEVKHHEKTVQALIRIVSQSICILFQCPHINKSLYQLIVKFQNIIPLFIPVPVSPKITLATLL